VETQDYPGDHDACQLSGIVAVPWSHDYFDHTAIVVVMVVAVF
jgi:hypothetical protein